MIRLKDGSINIADLIAKSEEPEQFRLIVGHVAAEKAKLAFSDEASGKRFSFTDVNLDVNNLGLSPGQPTGALTSKVNLGFTVAHSEKPQAQLVTTLVVDLTLNADKQYYAAQGLRLKSKGQVLGIEQFVLNCTGDFSGSLATESDAAEFMANNVAINVEGISG